MHIQIDNITVSGPGDYIDDFMRLAQAAFIAAGYAEQTFVDVVIAWLEENDIPRCSHSDSLNTERHISDFTE